MPGYQVFSHLNADKVAHYRLLAKLAQEEASQIESARQRLARGERQRLSEVGWLNPEHFHWLLELLGDALAQGGARDQPVEAFSADGTVRILLEPTDGEAVLQTSLGELLGRDHYLTIQSNP